MPTNPTGQETVDELPAIDAVDETDIPAEPDPGEVPVDEEAPQ